ncbi:protein DEFECTIVE IN MERISTEM SILENCING 3-like isoform X2 [Euphorbia lathyris]
MNEDILNTKYKSRLESTYEIDHVEFERHAAGGSNTHYFDLLIRLKTEQEHLFRSIQINEYHNLFDFISEKGLKIMNLGDMKPREGGVAAVLQNDDDDAVDPHLERIKNQAADESDEEDEDFVVDKDDGGSPTDDSVEGNSDGSDSGDEKEKPVKKAPAKEPSSSKVAAKKKPKDGNEDASKQKKPKKKKDPNAPKERKERSCCLLPPFNLLAAAGHRSFAAAADAVRLRRRKLGKRDIETHLRSDGLDLGLPFTSEFSPLFLSLNSSKLTLESSFPQIATPLPVSSLVQDLSALMKEEASIVPSDEMQNGGSMQAQSIIYNSKKLQDDLHAAGIKIKQHEDNLKILKSQRNKLEDSILDLQVILGNYHSARPPSGESESHSSNQSEAETVKQILQHETSAAGILCQLTTRYGTYAPQLAFAKDVVGIVATLGKVDDDNLSRLFSEYLGVETMLGIVCKTYEGVKALETYDKEGHINSDSGIRGFGTSIGRSLDRRFLVICLENLRPYCGEFVDDDPQRRLDLLKPKLPNGECPPGFIGFAVNMIHVDYMNLLYVSDVYGLRETLFYSLFSRLQVYKSREEMLLALPLISDGAISLDGGMIKPNGFFSIGNRTDVDVRFPKPSMSTNPPDSCMETENQLKQKTWEKEKLTEDLKREQMLLNFARFNFERKKEEFVKFLAQTSAYTAQ